MVYLLDSFQSVKDRNIGKIKNICCFGADHAEKQIYIFYAEIITPQIFPSNQKCDSPQ